MRPPVIIIGAPRSGTNMLRNVLNRLPGWATWDCDEINFIWRHGNRSHPDDELEPEQASGYTQRYVRREFDRLARRQAARVVVEKTCANSLRVGYVHRITPEARYLFIRRDGLDATTSALKRWHAPLDIPYLVRKSRYVPRSDVPYYGARFLRNRFRRLQPGGRAPSTWGPRLVDMDHLLTSRPLDEVCALQWRRCVDSAASVLSELPPSKVHEIAYENFVHDPKGELERVLTFLGEFKYMDAALVDGVSDRSVGKGRDDLTADQKSRLIPLLEPTLKRFGYV